MEQFLGTFQPVEEKTVGMKAYLEALQIPAAAIEGMLKGAANTKTTLSKEGDGYKQVTDYGDRKEEYTFKLGEPCTTNVMGMEVTHTYKMNADEKTREGVHVTGGNTTTSRSYVEGEFVVNELSYNGVTAKVYSKRV